MGSHRQVLRATVGRDAKERVRQRHEAEQAEKILQHRSGLQTDQVKHRGGNEQVGSIGEQERGREHGDGDGGGRWEDE